MPNELLEKNAIICIMHYDSKSKIQCILNEKAGNPLWGLIKFDSAGVSAKGWLGGFKPLITNNKRNFFQDIFFAICGPLKQIIKK